MPSSKASLCVLALTAASAGAFSAGRPATALARASVTRKGPHSSPRMNIFTQLMGGGYGGDAVMGDESIMSEKAHGTSDVPVQDNLRWNCDVETAGESCVTVGTCRRPRLAPRLSSRARPCAGPLPARSRLPLQWTG